MNAETILKVDNVSKHFSGVQAVKDVSFELMKGDVLGVIGPNGSGKTTLINLITGFIKQDQGRIVYKGQDVTNWLPHKIAEAGLVRTFQFMRPYHTLPAYKNLIPPLYSRRAAHSGRGKLGDRDAVAIDILEEIGFERDTRVPFKLAGALPLGYLKRLELGRCIALNPDLIICDEVFSGLSMSEIVSMVPLMQRLQDDGITLIMVEHRLRELFRIANRVIVLSFGEKIFEGTPEAVFDNEKVKEAYFGGEDTYVFK